jgi:hypothetical protein
MVDYSSGPRECWRDFVDESVTTDEKIVTSRAPIDLTAIVGAIDSLLLKE